MKITFEGNYHELREAIAGMGKTLHEADRPSLGPMVPVSAGMPFRNEALEALKRSAKATKRPAAKKRKR